MLIALAAVSLLLAEVTPAATPPGSLPGTAAADPAAPAKPEKPKKQKLICEAEMDTGSFIAKKVCRTREQIEAERVSARAWDQGIQDRQAACRNQANC